MAHHRYRTVIVGGVCSDIRETWSENAGWFQSYSWPCGDSPFPERFPFTGKTTLGGGFKPFGKQRSIIKSKQPKIQMLVAGGTDKVEYLPEPDPTALTPLKMAFSAIGMALSIYFIVKYGKGKGFWYGLAIWVGTNAAASGVGYLVDSVVTPKPE